MPPKRHCLICGTLIFSGFYCSDCSVELKRSRTSDEESLEEWIRNKSVQRTESGDSVGECVSLDNF